MTSSDRQNAVKIVTMTALILFFGFIAILFVRSGEQTMQRILAAGNAHTYARMAADHINVSIRTNDVIGRVDIEYIGRTGRNGLLIRHRTAAADFDKWIYFEDGYLLEMQTEPGESPELRRHNNYTIIAELYDFEIMYDTERNAVVLHLYYEHGGEIRVLTKIISLRSDRSDGIIVL